MWEMPSANSRVLSIAIFLAIVLFGALALTEIQRGNRKLASQLLTVSATASAILFAQIGYLAWRAMGTACVTQRKTALFLVLVLIMLAAPITLFTLAIVALKENDADNTARAARLISDMIIIATVASFVVLGPPPKLFKPL